MIVRTVKTSLTVGGSEYPILSYNLDLSRGALPQLSVDIPMGSSMSAGGMVAGVDVSDIKEGQDVEFALAVGNETILFKGVVKGTGTNIQLSATSNSSGKFTMRAEHELAKIGGLPVLSRAVVGAGKQSTTVIDTYRSDVLKSGKKNDSISYMLANQNTSGGFDGMLSGRSMPEFIIDLLIALYETEDKSVSPEKSAARSLDSEAIRILKDLKKNIVGGYVKESVTGKQQDQATFTMKMVERVSKIWGKSNGLDILRRMLNDVFFSLTPQLDGKITLRQNCPVYAKEALEMPSNLILGINRGDTFNATPIAGIRMRMPGLSNDYYADDESAEYIQYPDPSRKVGGLYQYINTQQFDVWFLFSSDYTPKKDSTGGGSPKTVSNPKGKEKYEKKNKGAETPYKDAKEALSLEVGKAAYAMQKWRNSSIVLRIAYEDSIKIGDVIKIDLTKAKAIADNIPTGVYYGFAEGIRLTGSPGNVSMSVRLTHVRNEKDNKEFGLQEYPMYEDPE